jgi:PX domain
MKKFQSIYYNQSKKVYINCRIEDHEIFNQSKFLKSKHVNYIINISTFYKNWIIKKRYSQFENLHNTLSQKITNLPEFPQKRLFSLSQETINERKVKFEFYLNFLFKNVNICVYPEILDFIELEKDLLNLFMINNSVIENSSNSAIKRNIIMRAKSSSVEKNLKSRSYGANSFDDNYFNSYLDYKFKLSDKKDKNSKSANMLVIEEFLRNLQFKYENKIDIIKTFEQFLKSKKNWPTFKLDELSKLFYGDLVTDNNTIIGTNPTNNNSFIGSRESSVEKNDIPLKGLIYHIGSREENLLGSEACLEFLGKLINFEFNPECEAYIYMLKITKIDQLNNMRLLEHINSGKHSIMLVVFSILKAILIEDKAYLIKLKKLINDENIINKFLNWYQLNAV